MKRCFASLFKTVYPVLFTIKPGASFTRHWVLFVLLAVCVNASAQTCTVINSIPATPPTSGNLDILYAARDSANYGVAGTLIHDIYDINGKGPYTAVPATNYFWNNAPGSTRGPLQRTGVWAASNPLTLGFSVCVDIPRDKDYYMGMAADNSGTLLVDGTVIVQGVDFMYWSIFKVHLTKGKHFVEFKVVNFQAEAALAFEIYDNTKAQILNAQFYTDLNLVFSTLYYIGAPVEEGDPSTSYSCPVGYILDNCTAGIPVCSQFVPITLTINNPAPACNASSVDITAPAITAGSPSSLTYTYWKDSQATIPLPNPQKVTESGTYYIMGSATDCQLIKPVAVTINSVTTTISKDICPGESFMGHNKTGSYTDILTAANGCDSLVTLNLTVSPKVNLGADRILCPGDTILLNPGRYSQYQWQDNTTSSQYLVTAPGTYSVRVTDPAGCSSADTVVISAGNCSLSKIPNTFTPNGDGVNDTWKLDALHDYPQCVVTIYNRWGQQVFYSIGYGNPWDGTQSGKKLPGGTYYYVIDLKNNASPVGGFVTIVR